MHILVTGASGFLGRFLSAALTKRGHRVLPLSSALCDLTREESLEPWSSQRFDQIYHLAAWTQAGNFCLCHPGQQWLINQKINTSLLSWWSRCQPQAKLICMGSSCAYDPSLPLEESYYLQGMPIDSLLSYAMTKRMLLCGLEALHREFGLSYLYFIPSTIYGTGYPLQGKQRHFIFDIIHKIVDYKLRGTTPVLWGDGEQRREIIHWRDLIEAMLHLAPIRSNLVINVGSGEEHSIRTFATCVCACLDVPHEKLRFDISQYVGARSKQLVIDRLQTLWPSYRPLPLGSSLRETIEDYANRLLVAQSEAI